MAAFPYPFPGTLEELLEIQETIPIDEEVPFSKRFKELYEESGGSPWGPQSTDRSKLAIRLWFAGWSRKQIMEIGLDPKHVENFRSNKGLTTGKPGRSTPTPSPFSKTGYQLGIAMKAVPPVGAAIAAALKTVQEKRDLVRADIDRLEQELDARRAELQVLDSMLNVGREDSAE